MLHWFNLNCYRDGDIIVRIHGNYCGPDWTAGQRISARSYVLGGGEFDVKPVDWLDALCLEHDRGCGSSDLGCSRRDDQRLIDGIDKWTSVWYNPLIHPIQNARALTVRSGIALAQPFRRR